MTISQFMNKTGEYYANFEKEPPIKLQLPDCYVLHNFEYSSCSLFGVTIMQMFQDHGKANVGINRLIINPAIFWSSRDLHQKPSEILDSNIRTKFYVPLFFHPRCSDNILGVGKLVGIQPNYLCYLDEAYGKVSMVRMKVVPLEWHEDKRCWWMPKRHLAFNCKFAYSSDIRFPFTGPVPIYDHVPQ